MKKRVLGKTGIQVSEIAFGGVEIGMPYGIGVKGATDMIAEADAIRLLHASLERGINFYDTARGYGRSELIIGKAFEGRRSEVVLCTKCQHFFHENESLPGYAMLKDIIEGSLSESLAALRTDYVDVFMLHQGNVDLLLNDDVSDIITKLKESGAIRSTGVSTYTPEETEIAIKTGVYDVIQLPLNLMDQRQAALFPLASREGTGIVVRSVLMKGVLSERGKGLHPALSDVQEHIRLYDALIDSSTPDLPTLATRFALSFPEVSSVLVGLDRQEYLDNSLQAADGTYLSEKAMSAARSLAYKDPEFLNLQTWSRMGWLV